MERMSRTEQGRQAEDHALSLLLKAGLKLVDRNYRSRFGEIDLIMEEGTTVVFVEVRYRTSNRFGSAQESVNRQKQHRLILTASDYIKDKRLRRPTRFDVAAITPGPSGFSMNWIKGAFAAE
jgi:putative endonuclease